MALVCRKESGRNLIGLIREVQENMIIKCRKCETNFRFDDQLMKDEGVWCRCSHCSNLFFQVNPSWEGQTNGLSKPDYREALPSHGEKTSLSAPIFNVKQAKGGTHSEQTSDARLLSHIKGFPV